jgi:5-methylthioadenosine/S-adenosylhomocysteine deaminase
MSVTARTLDAFDDAYTRGITRAPHQPREKSGVARPRDVVPVREPAAEPIALGGTVLTPDVQHKHGWVTIEKGVIADIRKTQPAGVRPIDTGGVILPGLIDLHGHPEYNVFSAWEPPKQYVNRAAWRSSDEYAAVVKAPWAQLTGGGNSTSLKATMTRYAEVRAIVGGVTAIQGASDAYPKKNEALCRNVDLWIFGEQIARSTVDFDRLTADDITSLKSHIADGSVKAHYVHLAEGCHGNVAAVHEFENFVASGLLSAATIVIHGTALSSQHFDTLKQAGAKLVWSPQSNLRLYGQTTDIAAAMSAGLTVGLGADWLPSGSRSLLDELQVARQVLNGTQNPPSNRDLVQMVTSRAATIAGLDDHLGKLEVDRPADLVVLERRAADGYDSVLLSEPTAVQLTMIGGDIVYGRSDWLAPPIVNPADYEPVLAWGRPMLLDTRLGSPETGPTPTGPGLRLADMRARLIARYPNVGPILS